MKIKTVLYADEGKILTNGSTTGKVVFIGDGDTIGNWSEIDEPEQPENTESAE